MKKLILSLFLLPALCFGQGAHRVSQVIVKGNGIAANVGPGAKIFVCAPNTGCATAANIYLDAGLTTPARNPVTADGSGNYDYYIASGCVDEQISSPGQGIILVSNVCPFNGQGGGGGGINCSGTCTPGSLPMFLSPSTVRDTPADYGVSFPNTFSLGNTTAAGLFVDSGTYGVDLNSADARIFMDGAGGTVLQEATGRLLMNSNAGGIGMTDNGGDIQLLVTNGPLNMSGDNVTVNAQAGSLSLTGSTNVSITGTATANLINGTYNTDRYASGAGNNGISNLFSGPCAAASCAATVPPTSTDTEAPIMPTNDNSVLFDQRLGRHLRAIKNPDNTMPCGLSGGGDASGDCLNLFINNITNRGWGRNTYMTYSGPGYNLGFSPNSPQSGVTANAAHETTFLANTRGISQIFGSTLISHAIGDKAMSYNYLYTDGGQTDGSGEGNIGATYRVQENVTYYHGTITSGGTTGSALLTTHNTSGQNAFTDGGYLLDITQGGVTGTISSATTVMGYGVWNFTSASMPVSTAWGTFNSDTNSAANGQFQIPVSQTINMTLGTSPASPGNFAVGTACLVNGFVETVPITAVGTTSGGVQSVTFSTRYAWKAGSLIMQGGMCGQYLTNTAAASWRTAIAAVGSFSATQVVLGACSHGSCNNASSALAFVVGTTGDSITQFPGAEIIGTNGGQSNTVQLGYNNAAWTNGDVIEGPHPPAVNMSALKIYANQLTKGNFSGSNIFVESWTGVNPAGSLGLNETFLSLTDNSKANWWWRIASGDSTGKISTLLQDDLPTDTGLIFTAPAQDIQLFTAYQPGGVTQQMGITSHGLTGDFEFRKNTSGLAQIKAGNVPPLGTLGQISMVTNTALNGQNYNPVSVSGDATLASTGALTLATVNGSPGSCGDSTHVCQVTTNGKGLVSTQSPVAIAFPAITKGRVALVAGTATVSTSSATASAIYSLTNCGVGGTQGMLTISAVSSGVSFTITSSSATDTSNVCWVIQ